MIHRAGHLWASGVVEMGWLGAGAAFPRTAAEPGLLPPPWRLRSLLLRCKSAMDSLPTVAHHRACHLRMHGPAEAVLIPGICKDETQDLQSR